MALKDQKKTQGSCRCCCRNCICVAGLLLLSFGIMSTYTQSRFTPIFRDIVCDEPEISIGDVDLKDSLSLHVVLNVGMRCANPNSISVAIEQPEAGTLSLAPKASGRRLEVNSGWLDNLFDDDDEEKHSISTTTMTTTLGSRNSITITPKKDDNHGNKESSSSSGLVDDIVDWIGDKIDGNDNKSVATDDKNGNDKNKSSNDVVDDVVDWIKDKIDGKDNKSVATDDKNGSSGGLVDDVVDWIGDKIDGNDNKSAATDDKNKGNLVDDVVDWIGDKIDGKDNKSAATGDKNKGNLVDDVVDWIGDKLDGKDKKSVELGTIKLLPSTLWANQNSTVSLRGNIVLDGVDAVGTIAKLLDPVNIRFELGLKTQVMFFGKRIGASQDDKVCGVQVDVTKGKSGEAVCGESFAGLRIPPITKNASKQPITFNAKPEDVKEAEELKDLVLNIAQVIGYGCGIASMSFWLAMILKGCFSKPGEKSAPEARAVTVTRSESHAVEVV